MGSLKLGKKDNVEMMPCTDAIQLRYALVRRGLALDQANILEFKLHDQWTEKLFYLRQRSVPPGYTAVTMRQLEEADKSVWSLLAEKTRGGIKMQPSGRPCDKHFETCMESADVLHFLQPMPMTGMTSHEQPWKKQRTDDGTKAKGKGRGGNVPLALLNLGAVARTSKGNAICFNYNLKKCSVRGSKCDKGIHICAVKGCHKSHAAVECAKKGIHESQE